VIAEDRKALERSAKIDSLSSLLRGRDLQDVGDADGASRSFTAESRAAA